MTEPGHSCGTTFSERLLIKTTTLPLDVVTATLGLIPTRSSPMHSGWGGRAPKANMWYLQAPDDCVSIAQQWAWLAERLAGKSGLFESLVTDCELRLDVVVFGARPAPSLSIPGGMLEFATEAGFELAIYFYDFSDGDAEDGRPFCRRH